MTALFHEFDLADATAFDAPSRPADPARLAARWEAVHEAAAAVAALAQVEADHGDADLPHRAAALGGWQFEMVERGVDDLSAVLRPGLRALLGIAASGRDTTTAAKALWGEFLRARTAIAGLVGGG